MQLREIDNRRNQLRLWFQNVVGTGPANPVGSTEILDPTARRYGQKARKDFWKPICNQNKSVSFYEFFLWIFMKKQKPTR